MKTKLIAALIVGSFVLAGCGGGSGDTARDEEMRVADQERIDELVEQLEEAQDEAEQERLAREQAEAAEAQAQADRERLVQEAEERRQAAEERLAQSREERQSAGFGTSAGTLVVTPRYPGTENIPIPIPAVIKTPDIVSPSVVADDPWDMTTGSSSDGTYRDSVMIYSDVEMPTQVAFQDSTYNTGPKVVNAEGKIIAGYSIRRARTDVGGTLQDESPEHFPLTSLVPMTYKLIDRGSFDTEEKYNAALTACGADMPCQDAVRDLSWRNKEMYPLRYSVNDVTTATLGGASGIFRCESRVSTMACTVQNRGGGQLFFTGPWTFRPTVNSDDIVTAQVTVADQHFMWFGWWARENIATKEWSYAVGHGPAGSRVSSVSAVSGNATYTGSAIGRFAIDQPLDDTDQVGAFTAAARLSADFDENTLSGTLDTFMGDAVPTQTGDGIWTVHLRKGSISGGSASGTSAWSIGVLETTDNVDEGGSWSANFYSNLPANQRTGVMPYGVAGTFTAEHSGAANMIGAFGAHRE